MSDQQEPMSREQLEGLAVRQHKLINKLKGELGNLMAVNSEQAIIIDEFKEHLDGMSKELPTDEEPVDSPNFEIPFE